MRIKGILKHSQKPYLITDRLRKYGRIPLEKYLLRIKDFPEVKYFETLKEAKDYLQFAEAYFSSLTFGNSEDIPIV